MLGAELALLLALSQPAPTVVLIIDGQELEVTIAQVERLRRSPDMRYAAAATIALGTRATLPEPVILAPWDFERERWQRQPAQAPIPGPADQ